jgi:hypothetical protein
MIVQQVKRDFGGSSRFVEMTPARPAPDVSPDRLEGSELEARKFACIFRAAFLNASSTFCSVRKLSWNAFIPMRILLTSPVLALASTKSILYDTDEQ